MKFEIFLQNLILKRYFCKKQDLIKILLAMANGNSICKLPKPVF